MPNRCNVIEMEDSEFKQSRNFRLISTYRVSLVKDKGVVFPKSRATNTQQWRSIVRKLITEHGQADREQLCVILLNVRNDIIGLNIVATGSLSSASVSPREVLKPAILANAAAIIICHNHPGNDLNPSPEDYRITRMIVQAAKFVDIIVHDHLIINMEDSRYYSFANSGFIKIAYDECNSIFLFEDPLNNIRAAFKRLKTTNHPSIQDIDNNISALYAYFNNVTEPYFKLLDDFNRLKATFN
jgi:DNA repair protein RadC